MSVETDEDDARFAWQPGSLHLVEPGTGPSLAELRRRYDVAHAEPLAVGYRDRSDDPAQRCARCVKFAPPGACVAVRGPIDPAGWCRQFAP